MALEARNWQESVVLGIRFSGYGAGLCLTVASAIGFDNFKDFVDFVDKYQKDSRDFTQADAFRSKFNAVLGLTIGLVLGITVVLTELRFRPVMTWFPLLRVYMGRAIFYCLVGSIASFINFDLSVFSTDAGKIDLWNWYFFGGFYGMALISIIAGFVVPIARKYDRNVANIVEDTVVTMDDVSTGKAATSSV